MCTVKLMLLKKCGNMLHAIQLANASEVVGKCVGLVKVKCYWLVNYSVRAARILYKYVGVNMFYLCDYYMYISLPVYQRNILSKIFMDALIMYYVICIYMYRR